MNTRGFSLVEVVLAIGIFAFAALAVIALLGRGMKTSGDARLESVSALLSGKVNSILRASSAWDANTMTTNAKAFTQNQSLAQIAAGSSVLSTNYYNGSLSNVSDADTDRQFAMAVRVEPFTVANFSSTNADVNAALGSLPAAQNTVLLNVEVSFPAIAPEQNRTKRSFSSIITRTSPN